MKKYPSRKSSRKSSRPEASESPLPVEIQEALGDPELRARVGALLRRTNRWSPRWPARRRCCDRAPGVVDAPPRITEGSQL